MLILKFNEDIKRKRSLFKKDNIIYKTSGFILKNTVFNVIELQKKNLKSDEIKLLLKRYKGSVLGTSDSQVNDYLKEYLFNYSPYLKRSLISSVSKAISREANACLKVFDDEFKFSDEWIELAEKCKKIILIGVENNDMKIFSDYCFNEFGLNVFVNDLSMCDNKEMCFDLNITENDEYLNLYGALRLRVYPDEKYFIADNYAKKLIAFGVPEKMACAAVQVIGFKKIYASVDP